MGSIVACPFRSRFELIMKNLFLLLMVCAACGGKLSDDQRQRLHEGMATQDIKKVSEADLQLAALTYAQSVMREVEKADQLPGQSLKIDSIATARQVKIYSLIPDDSALRQIEKQLVEAYIAGANPEQAGENLQKIGEDSLLYTKPVFMEEPDGSQRFSYAIGIKMARKTIVLSMPTP